MQKFGVLVAGLAVLTSTALAQSKTKAKTEAKAVDKTLSLAQLPAKSNVHVLGGSGTIRLKDGIITSDKPVQVISREAITVLPGDGIRVGQSMPVISAKVIVITALPSGDHGIVQSKPVPSGKTKTKAEVREAGVEGTTLSLAQLPAKSDGLMLSSGTIRLKDGITTSDKPMRVIARKPITVLPGGGIYIGQLKPGLPKGTKVSPTK